jgi:hypothetical protein
MTLAELFTEIGDENLEFQMLAQSFKSAHVGTKDGTITFYTGKEKVHDMMNAPPKFTCFIVWVPTDKLNEVTGDL